MAFFDFLNNPKTIYITRLVQIFFSTFFLVCICYAGVHRAWWNNINAPLALGVVAVLFTLVVASYTVITYHRTSNPFAARGAVYTIVRLAVEILTFLLWVGSAVLALRPHGGCDPQHRSSDSGQDRCYKHTDSPDPNWKYTEQPLITWDIAITLSFVEIVAFALTILLVFKDNRANKVSDGGATYGA
ncbi:hypothetical protein G7Y79_00047g083500 [Physcia stellaris]|nr:hypothetical protein G7Y79_00047g083500 [Physcia stellaris]